MLKTTAATRSNGNDRRAGNLVPATRATKPVAEALQVVDLVVGTERPRPTNCSAYLPRVIPKNSSLHRLDFKGLNQFFGEVTAMQLKRDRVRAHVWGRVTARFNAIAENCAGVWKL